MLSVAGRQISEGVPSGCTLLPQKEYTPDILAPAWQRGMRSPHPPEAWDVAIWTLQRWVAREENTKPTSNAEACWKRGVACESRVLVRNISTNHTACSFPAIFKKNAAPPRFDFPVDQQHAMAFSNARAAGQLLAGRFLATSRA